MIYRGYLHVTRHSPELDIVAKRVDGDVAFLNTRCAYRVLKRRLHRTV